MGVLGATIEGFQLPPFASICRLAGSSNAAFAENQGNNPLENRLIDIGVKSAFPETP